MKKKAKKGNREESWSQHLKSGADRKDNFIAKECEIQTHTEWLNPSYRRPAFLTQLSSLFPENVR